MPRSLNPHRRGSKRDYFDTFGHFGDTYLTDVGKLSKRDMEAYYRSEREHVDASRHKFKRRPYTDEEIEMKLADWKQQKFEGQGAHAIEDRKLGQKMIDAYERQAREGTYAMIGGQRRLIKGPGQHEHGVWRPTDPYSRAAEEALAAATAHDQAAAEKLLDTHRELIALFGFDKNPKTGKWPKLATLARQMLNNTGEGNPKRLGRTPWNSFVEWRKQDRANEILWRGLVKQSVTSHDEALEELGNARYKVGGYRHDARDGIEEEADTSMQAIPGYGGTVLRSTYDDQSGEQLSAIERTETAAQRKQTRGMREDEEMVRVAAAQTATRIAEGRIRPLAEGSVMPLTTSRTPAAEQMRRMETAAAYEEPVAAVVRQKDPITGRYINVPAPADPFAEGNTVTVKGIIARPSLNGKQAKIVGRARVLGEKKIYPVEIIGQDGNPERMRLPLRNLAPAAPPVLMLGHDPTVSDAPNQRIFATGQAAKEYKTTKGGTHTIFR